VCIFKVFKIFPHLKLEHFFISKGEGSGARPPIYAPVFESLATALGDIRLVFVGSFLFNSALA